MIHEQNSVAGLTNRLLSRLASRTLFAFPAAFPQREGWWAIRCAPPSPPCRRPRRVLPAAAALARVVVGGSLGAQALNEALPAALARLPATQRPQVTHQAGAKAIDALRAAYAAVKVNADCRSFIDDMASEYAQADLVICRAGALTVAELAAVGWAVLVPYPHAVDDHQTGNAPLSG